MLTNEDITADPRFRRAIMSGEYYRSVSVFLRLQFPEIEDTSRLPREYIANAKRCVDNALFDFLEIRKELEQEMI